MQDFSKIAAAWRRSSDEWKRGSRGAGRSYAAAVALAIALVGASGSARAQSTQAAPVAAVAPAPDAETVNYRIGAGDLLDIRVLGQEQMSGQVRVSNEGFIRVPFVDEDIRAQCRTEREVAESVQSKLKKYLKFPEVHVAVKELVGNPVSITGAVAQPQQIRSQRRLSLLETIVLAGGLTEKSGSLAFVFHSGTVAACDGAVASDQAPSSDVVNLARLKKGDVAENRTLVPGDIVIVPDADNVFVLGEVLKPNAYSLTDGLTLSKLLALAGGTSSLAKTDAVRIVRREPGKSKVEIPVNLKNIQNNKQEDPLLLANDIVEVPSSTGKKILNGFLTTIGGSVGNLPVRAIP